MYYVIFSKPLKLHVDYCYGFSFDIKDSLYSLAYYVDYLAGCYCWILNGGEINDNDFITKNGKTYNINSPEVQPYFDHPRQRLDLNAYIFLTLEEKNDEFSHEFITQKETLYAILNNGTYTGWNLGVDNVEDGTDD